MKWTKAWFNFTQSLPATSLHMTDVSPNPRLLQARLVSPIQDYQAISPQIETIVHQCKIKIRIYAISRAGGFCFQFYPFKTKSCSQHILWRRSVRLIWFVRGIKIPDIKIFHWMCYLVYRGMHTGRANYTMKMVSNASSSTLTTDWKRKTTFNMAVVLFSRSDT